MYIYFLIKFSSDQNSSSPNFMALKTVQAFKNKLNNQNTHSKNMKIQAFVSFKINHITLYIKTDR